jgi:hypothetical protein
LGSNLTAKLTANRWRGALRSYRASRKDTWASCRGAGSGVAGWDLASVL